MEIVEGTRTRTHTHIYLLIYHYIYVIVNTWPSVCTGNHGPFHGCPDQFTLPSFSLFSQQTKEYHWVGMGAARVRVCPRGLRRACVWAPRRKCRPPPTSTVGRGWAWPGPVDSHGRICGPNPGLAPARVPPSAPPARESWTLGLVRRDPAVMSG